MPPFRHPESVLRELGIPTEFLAQTIGPLYKIKEARVTEGALERLKVVISPMDFATGAVNPECPSLLRLMELRDVQSIVLKAKPWIDCHGYDHRTDFSPWDWADGNPTPNSRYNNADQLCSTLMTWVMGSSSEAGNDSLFDYTSWRQRNDPAAARWLGVPFTDDYIWYQNAMFHNYKKGPREIGGSLERNPEKPHALCYVVDSTPFGPPSSLRTSEVKSIALLALFNHVKPAYVHLDSFGVTLISFCGCDVRILQGLVNLKTRDIDIRVTAAQSFKNGFRGADGSIDTRFLTLMAYNCADVLPLPN